MEGDGYYLKGAEPGPEGESSWKPTLAKSQERSSPSQSRPAVESLLEGLCPTTAGTTVRGLWLCGLGGCRLEIWWLSSPEKSMSSGEKAEHFLAAQEDLGPPSTLQNVLRDCAPLSLTKRFRSLLLRSSWGMAQNSGSVQIKVFLVSSPGFECRLYPFRGVSLGKSVSTAGLSFLLREMGRLSVIYLPPPAQCLMWSWASTHPVCPTPHPLCFGVSSLSDPGEGAHW